MALERRRDDDVSCGEIETAHPGYLGSQDTFYVGTMKGVGPNSPYRKGWAISCRSAKLIGLTPWGFAPAARTRTAQEPRRPHGHQEVRALLLPLGQLR